MCGRYVLKHSREDLQLHFQFDEFAVVRLFPRFNIAPTQSVPVIRLGSAGSRELVEGRWGLIPSWVKDGDKPPLLINARLEDVATRRAFAPAFRGRRCLVPASGYYEWGRMAGGRKKPYFIDGPNGAPLAFAGLWEPYGDGMSVALMTKASVGNLAEIHDRMPVILPESSWPSWLAPEPLSAEGCELLQAPELPCALGLRPVGPLVNSARNEGPELLRPDEPDLFGE